ncbi:MAG: SPASM domain-containing protein, partial [Clostridia bacterium]|nr:SPASM domain-containing protein [Clostridia bacterium]
GDLYPCHQFVGDKDYCMGNVFDGIQNVDLRTKFQSCNVYSRPECADCWAKLYCSGGCAANAYHATGSVRGIYKNGCRLFRKRMECAIMVAIARALGDNKA